MGISREKAQERLDARIRDFDKNFSTDLSRTRPGSMKKGGVVVADAFKKKKAHN